jgi:phosphotransferase system enzyme I (PtsP)
LTGAIRVWPIGSIPWAVRSCGLQQIVEAAGENEHAADAVWRDCRQSRFRPWRCSGLVSATISMAPAAIGPVKSMLLSLDLAKLEQELLPVIADTESEKTVREFLTDFADANGVSL